MLLGNVRAVFSMPYMKHARPIYNISSEDVQLCWICVYILYKKCSEVENLMFGIATKVFALDEDCCFVLI